MAGQIKSVTLTGPQGNTAKLEQSTCVLGRGSEWGITDKRCSRNQAEIAVSENAVTLIAHGVNPTYITRSRSGKTISMAKDQAYPLQDGDSFTLLVNEYPFTIKIEHSEPPQRPPKSASEQKWTCSVCTFANAASDAKCVMCETDKDPEAPIAAPAAKKRKFDESASPKKKPTEGHVKDDRPLCRYGATCYRKNPQHRQEFRHPDPEEKPATSDTKKRKRVEGSETSKATKAAKAENENAASKKKATGDEEEPDSSNLKQSHSKKTLRVIPRKDGHRIAAAIISDTGSQGSEDDEDTETIKDIKKLQPHTDTTIKVHGSGQVVGRAPELTAASKATTSPETPHDKALSRFRGKKGAKWLAFPSFSTGVFQFNAEKAAEAISKAVVAFLKEHTDPEIRLFLVLHEDESSLAALYKEVEDSRLKVMTGDIARMKSSHDLPVCCIANETNWRMRPGGSAASKAVHDRAGPALEIDSKRLFGTAKVGEACPVAVDPSSPLSVEEDACYVIHCLGPNMNDSRPDSLGGDYERGTAELARTYSSLFACFHSLAFHE